MHRTSSFSLTRLNRRSTRLSTIVFLLLISIACLVITPLYLVYKPPASLIGYFEGRWPDVLFQVATQYKVVALTIDDGPSRYTGEIRQLLKENGARATWFVIGNQVKGREAELKLLLENGNELGNHAMEDEPSRLLSDDELGEQIKDVDSKLQVAYTAARVAGPPPKYFRPGSDLFSDRMRQKLQELKYRLVLGSINPHDAEISSWRLNAAHILSSLKPGAIIMCHDRRSWTLPMLKKILPEIRKRGYRIVTVTELLKEAED